MFDVHPNLVAGWKKQAIEQLPETFAGQHARSTHPAAIQFVEVCRQRARAVTHGLGQFGQT